MSIYTEVKDWAFSTKSASPATGKVHGSGEDNLCVLMLGVSPFPLLFPPLRFPSSRKNFTTCSSIPGHGSYSLATQALRAPKVAFINVHCPIIVPQVPSYQ